MFALVLAGTLSLVPIGTASVRKGDVAIGKDVIVVTEGEDSYSPLAPDKAQPTPKSAKPANLDVKACRAMTQKSEVVAIATEGDLSVKLTRGHVAGDIFGYAPLSIEAKQGKAATTQAMDIVAYACGIHLGNYDGKPGNEIAVTWISAGGSGYTTGVTLFRVQLER